MKHHSKTIESLKLQNRLLWTFAYFVVLGGLLYVTQDSVLSPCSDHGCHVQVKTVYATDGRSFDRIVTDYIMEVFEPEGLDVQIKAVECFASEGIRFDKKTGKHFDEKAYNFNTNGTWDYGIAQWNQVHGQKMSDIQGYKKQIQLAYKLYKSRGNNFDAWYGKGCR